MIYLLTIIRAFFLELKRILYDQSNKCVIAIGSIAAIYVVLAYYLYNDVKKSNEKIVHAK